MSEQEADVNCYKLVNRFASRLKLTPAERREAVHAMGYYIFRRDDYPWCADTLTPRQRTIDEAVVVALAEEYAIGVSDSPERAPFQTSRVTAARLRHSVVAVPPRRLGRVRSKAGRRG